MAATISALAVEREQMIDHQLDGHGAVFGQDWVVVIGQEKVPVRVTSFGDRYAVAHGRRVGPDASDGRDGQGSVDHEVDGRPARAAGDHEHEVETQWRPGDDLCLATIDGRAVAIQTERRGVGYRLTTRGAVHDVRDIDQHP